MLIGNLNADGSVEIEIGGGKVCLGAAELDHMLQTLGELRARMPEEVSQTQAQIEAVLANPLYSVRLDKQRKACLLSLRHPGFGWINFELPAQEVLNMRTLWNQIVDRMELEPPAGYYDGPERRQAKPH